MEKGIGARTVIRFAPILVRMIMSERKATGITQDMMKIIMTKHIIRAAEWLFLFFLSIQTNDLEKCCQYQQYYDTIKRRYGRDLGGLWKMKLVNIAERFKDKKEIIHQIAQIAPEILSSKNIGEMVEKLGHLGAVTLEEKTYCEMRLQAKKICLMAELIFKKHGIEGFSGLNFVDRENQSKFGKLIVVSHPHLPKEFVDHFDGKEIEPFGGSCARSMVLNKIIEVQNIEKSLLFSEEQINMMMKYGFYSNISFPIHYDDGELIGSLFVIHETKEKIEEELKTEIRELIVNLEHILTMLQEGWSNKEIIRFKGIMSPELVMVYVEPTCEEVIGYGPKDMFYQRDLAFFVHPDDRERVALDLKPLSEGISTRTFYRCKTKWGSFIPVDMLSIPIKELDGTVRYIENYNMFNTFACKEFKSMLDKKMAHQ